MLSLEFESSTWHEECGNSIYDGDIIITYYFLTLFNLVFLKKKTTAGKDTGLNIVLNMRVLHTTFVKGESIY